MPQTVQRAALAVYTTTIFLSALLLFSVQPMFAKMVLPLLGGASAVWAVSMCFFQALLLAGYAWAHLLDSRASPRLALGLQLAVLCLALATLPIGIGAASADTAAHGAYLQLIGILAVGVGLPFFALAANAPLLQAWFSRLGHTESANPYMLYRVSNAGSLLALAAYPFLLEPLLPLRLQSRLWAAGFVLLVAAISACGWLMLSAPRQADTDAPAPDSAGTESTPAYWRTRLGWAFLAFVPSGLLVAFTTYVTTDLASAPLLWVIPLALYLATFIAAFRDVPPISLRLLALLQPGAVALTLVLMEWDASFSWVLSCLAGTLAFAISSLLCHMQLYRLRPAARRLTDFYLWLSLGGALGGVFAALVAPQLFGNVLEFPLLLALGMAARLGLQEVALPDRRHMLATLGLAVLVALAVAYLAPWSWTPNLRVIALAIFAAAVVAAFRWPAVEQAAVLALVLALALLPNGNRPVHVARTFYGTHKVVEPPGGVFRLLLHGVTLHGAERIADTRPSLAGRPLPLTYYHPSGPLARGVLLARLAAGGGPASPLRVGIVGLGTGAMACHARDGDRWRFFELDPEVIRIATDPAYFTYLSACQPDAALIAGDARLTLAREPAGSFDYLVIDAFSSDAIPIHLLTVEAMQLYASLLSERGVLAIHVSNRNFDLPPIVEAGLARVPALKGIYTQGEGGGGAIRSQVILIARDEAVLAPALDWPKSRRLDKPTVHAWTDDYSDVVTPFLRRLRDKLRE